MTCWWWSNWWSNSRRRTRLFSLTEGVVASSCPDLVFTSRWINDHQWREIWRDVRRRDATGGHDFSSCCCLHWCVRLELNSWCSFCAKGIIITDNSFTTLVWFLSQFYLNVKLCVWKRVRKRVLWEEEWRLLFLLLIVIDCFAEEKGIEKGIERCVQAKYLQMPTERDRERKREYSLSMSGLFRFFGTWDSCSMISFMLSLYFLLECSRCDCLEENLEWRLGEECLEEEIILFYS